MPLTLNYYYCQSADIQGILSSVGEFARLDDDNDGVLSGEEATWEQNAIYWATVEVNRYSLQRYSDLALSQSPIVNVYCSALATRWLCRRRGNPCPEGIEAYCKDAVEFFKAVSSGNEQIADIGQREACFPAWSNIRVDPLKLLRKAVVERPISDRQPTTYPQDPDYGADWILRPL